MTRKGNLIIAPSAEQLSVSKWANRKLGKDQVITLRLIADRNNGQWWNGCGWLMANRSGMARLIRSLTKRGLLEHSVVGLAAACLPSPDVYSRYEQGEWVRDVYTITGEGRRTVAAYLDGTLDYQR